MCPTHAHYDEFQLLTVQIMDSIKSLAMQQRGYLKCYRAFCFHSIVKSDDMACLAWPGHAESSNSCIPYLTLSGLAILHTNYPVPEHF